MQTSSLSDIIAINGGVFTTFTKADVFLALITGVISGIISNFIMYIYSSYKDRTPVVLNYLKTTTDFLRQIDYEIGKCNSQKELENLVRLIERKYKTERTFKYKKDEEKIHSIIILANKKISEIYTLVTSKSFDEAMGKINDITWDIPGILIDASNEAIDYRMNRNKNYKLRVINGTLCMVGIIVILFMVA